MATRPLLHVAYADQPLFCYEVALENRERPLTDSSRLSVPPFLADYPFVCFSRLLWWN